MGFFRGEKMKKEFIDLWLKTGIIRIRQRDTEKIKSMIQSAEINVGVTKSVPLNEDSGTLIFREIYESIRQLGDAYWLSLGYEPSNHEISLDALKELSIKNGVKLNFLSRFKQIRHDANYKGFRVSTAQAKEIIEFWGSCGKDIINAIKSKLREDLEKEDEGN